MTNLPDEVFEIGEKEFQFLVDEFGLKKRARKKDTGVHRLLYETKTTDVANSFE